jgi:two-component system, OmpR family, heavy metal sensor histidine kinase CusS
MSSKNAEHSPRAWSLAGRLSLFISLTSFALLAVAALSLYWNLARSLEGEIVRFLQDKLYVVEILVRDRFDDPAALDEEIRIESAARRFSRYYVRIIDDMARPRIETPGMSRVAAPGEFARLTASRIDASGFQKMQLADGRTMALTAAATRTRDGKPWKIQLGLDISAQERLLASYRGSLMIVLLLGLALSALAGRIIARRGLQPLGAITAVVRETSASKLDMRVSSASWPQELSCLAAAFDDMLSRLQESFRRISQFSADIAHELRTPVTNMLAATQVTLSRSRSLEEYQRVIESSSEELATLARIIDALLFLARAEQASCPLEREQLDARQEIENVIEFHRASADESEVALRCEGHAAVFADSTLFQRAISNLLSNAVRHTPRRGSVLVDIRTAERETLITVRDTGNGIPAEHLPHLFDRFYRVDPSRTQASGGFGLGLAIVKSIVTLHEGAIRVDSTPGAGTAVTLTLPLLAH